MVTTTTPPTVGVSLPAETHVEQSQPDRNSVFQIIREQLSDILEIEPAQVTESSSFVEDLEADSLALIELVEGLEEELLNRMATFYYVLLIWIMFPPSSHEKYLIV